MEGLGIGIGFLRNAFVLQSKAFLFFLPLLLVMVALPPLETVMPTMWHAATRGLFHEPAFAFLLLNSLIVSIIASSKLGRGKGGHNEDENNRRESTREMEEGADSVVEQYSSSQIDSLTGNRCGYHMNEGKYLLRSGHSLNANANCKLNIKQVLESMKIDVDEKQPLRRDRLARRGSEKVGLHHPNKPLNHNSEGRRKLMRGSISFSSDSEGYLRNPNLEKKIHDNNFVDGKLGRAGNGPDHQAHHIPAAAAMGRPSLEEVWTAIMTTRRDDDRMASMQRSCNKSKHGNTTHPQPGVATDAPTPLAAAAGTRPAAAAEPRNPLKVAAAAPPTRPSEAPSKAQYAAVMEGNHVEDAGGGDEEDDSELKELNRRAEEFIARFNQQMRLQRQESLQREKARAARRSCTSDIHVYPKHVQLPARGLLVG